MLLVVTPYGKYDFKNDFMKHSTWHLTLTDLVFIKRTTTYLGGKTL